MELIRDAFWIQAFGNALGILLEMHWEFFWDGLEMLFEYMHWECFWVALGMLFGCSGDQFGFIIWQEDFSVLFSPQLSSTRMSNKTV